jgi:DNA (cytosine-5)-methyltransferase 1
MGCAELLAAQYGAPQMRWRLIIVLVRSDLGIPAPTRGATAVGDLLPSVTVPPYAYAGFLTARDAIGDLPPVDAGGSNNAYTGRPERPYQQAARPCATDSRRVAAQPQADEVRKAVSPMGGSREKARG